MGMSDPSKFIGYGCKTGCKKVDVIELSLRNPSDHEVIVKTTHCGCCHSDIHCAHGEWAPFPSHCVPGHEIVGIVHAVGPKVSLTKVGDRVMIGCLVNSCGDCQMCKVDQQVCCPEMLMTYNSTDPVDGKITTGGYGDFVLANERFVIAIPDSCDPALVAPVGCCSLTVYRPLIEHGAKVGGLSIGVVGLGGLGHMAVQWGRAFGNKVVVFTRSSKSNKVQLAKDLGADIVCCNDDPDT